MTTYAEGKRIRYPRPGHWVRAELHDDADSEKGMVTCVREDGTVEVAWDEGDTYSYEPDTLFLHGSGWYWVVPAEGDPSPRGWG